MSSYNRSCNIVQLQFLKPVSIPMKAASTSMEAVSDNIDTAGAPRASA